MNWRSLSPRKQPRSLSDDRLQHPLASTYADLQGKAPAAAALTPVLRNRVVWVCLILTPLLGSLARPVARPAVAADPLLDTGRWQTYAGGDEILALGSPPGATGQLWSGTEGGGLLVWDLGRETFEQFLFPQQAGLLSNVIHDLAFDARGNAWLATGEGVSRVPTSLGGAWQAYGVSQGLPDVLVTAIAVDAAGAVWAGTPEGVAVLDVGAADFREVVAVDLDATATDPLDGPGAPHVQDIAVGTDGKVYLAHGRGKLTAVGISPSSDPQPALSVYDPARGGWRHVAAADPLASQPSGPPSDKIMRLSMAPDGRLWMGTWSRGVIVWDGAAEWQSYLKRDGLCENYVWAVTALAGETWAACGSTNGQGAYVARWDGQRWELFDDDQSWPTAVLTSFAQVGGQVYAGANGSGLADGMGGAGIIPVDAAGLAQPALRASGPAPAANDITAMVFTDDGTLWAGTREQGLLRRDPGLPRVWHQYTYDNTGTRLAGNTITGLALRQAPDGTPELWVTAGKARYDGTITDYVEGGVSRLNLRTWVWDLTLRSRDEPELSDANLGSVAIGDDRRVWMGTGTGLRKLGANPNSGRGVLVYDPETGVWETLRQQGSRDDALAGNTVPAIAARGALLWLATSYSDAFSADQSREGGGVTMKDAAGLVSWRGGQGGFLSLIGTDTREKDLTGDVVSIAIDGDGKAWAGTYQGVVTELTEKFPLMDAVVNRQVAAQGQVWEQPAWDGAAGSGWVSALQADSRGRMWAGTSRGHFAEQEAMREVSPSGDWKVDSAVGGAVVWDEAARSWIELTPLTSGLAANAIAAFAVDPTTGYMWVGLEDGGFSVYQDGQPWKPTVTPGPTATPVTATPRPTVADVTATPGPGQTPGGTPDTGPAIRTVAAQGGDDEDDGPEPPPEVPEPATWLLMAIGLGAAAAMIALRRRQAAA
ncbi:MAG: PEP-CTERM sorting domain-containing protein [Ardenticatenia bacterium]|nr:PEP-CTERM sorting domain-containing protein [Ardenticatenia bacterium]